MHKKVVIVITYLGKDMGRQRGWGKKIFIVNTLSHNMYLIVWMNCTLKESSLKNRKKTWNFYNLGGIIKAYFSAHQFIKIGQNTDHEKSK